MVEFKVRIILDNDNNSDWISIGCCIRMKMRNKTLPHTDRRVDSSGRQTLGLAKIMVQIRMTEKEIVCSIYHDLQGTSKVLRVKSALAKGKICCL